jgi:hypothetical protein
LPFWLPPLLLDLDGANLLVRAGLCVLTLAPAGLLMGFGFPTGMRLVSAVCTGLTPWFWGINGAAGVLAASVAVVTSIAFSIDTTLRIGAVCYLPGRRSRRVVGVRRRAIARAYDPYTQPTRRMCNRISTAELNAQKAYGY